MRKQDKERKLSILITFISDSFLSSRTDHFARAGDSKGNSIEQENGSG